VWLRKFRAAPSTREERAKQMRFLQSRGFSFDAIRAVIRGADEE
jgi:regulatory protein